MRAPVGNDPRAFVICLFLELSLDRRYKGHGLLLDGQNVLLSCLLPQEGPREDEPPGGP